MASKTYNTPLAKKLGLKSGHSALIYKAPEHYFDLFADLPDEVHWLNRGKNGGLDFIHAFFTREKDLKKVAAKHKSYLKKTGSLWVSWPKASSALATDLKRDWVRNYFLDVGLVDVKVASIDDDWSAAKFMYRTKDR